ncbi:MAG: recombinase RecT [Bacteroidota bacterium]
MSSIALSRGTAFSKLQAQLAKNAHILAAALPNANGANPSIQIARAQRSARCAMSLVRTNQKILDCDPASILGSILQACQLGLELDGVMGEAYLIPYGQECQMQVGYRGLVTLVRRSGLVEDIWPTLVYSNEPYKVSAGDIPSIIHERIMDDATRGNLSGVYATAVFMSKRIRHHAMTLGEVSKHRDASKSGAKGPWKDYYETMVRKTAVRALCKHLPQCTEAQKAAIHDEYVATGHAPQQPTIAEIPISEFEELSEKKERGDGV